MIEIVGSFNRITGVSEGARLCYNQLKEAGVSVRYESIEQLIYQPKEIEFLETNNSMKPKVQILHISPPNVFRCILRGFKIGYFAWEFNDMPLDWEFMIKRVDAVMTPSTFSTELLQKYTTKPIVTVPHPVKYSSVFKNMREKLGIGKDIFLVSYIFNLETAVERKNPFALIKAFNELDNSYCLVLKTCNGNLYTEDLQKLYPLPANTILIDEIWPKEDVVSLISESDVYCSPHRAEGFGLTIAEAIMQETPVIATNWSANTDFCDPLNTNLLDYDLIDVIPHKQFHNIQSKWAEVHSNQIVSYIKNIKKNKEGSKIRAVKAKQYLEKYIEENTYIKALKHLNCI